PDGAEGGASRRSDLPSARHGRAPPRGARGRAVPNSLGSAADHALTLSVMRVGVFGATGQVGGVMRRLLAERSFPVDELRYFASARSAGRTLPWGDGEIVVEE